MVWMFARQTELVASLVEALKSKGAIDKDDFEAYQRLARSMEIASRDITVATADQYSIWAEQLGLGDDIPGRKDQNPKPGE